MLKTHIILVLLALSFFYNPSLGFLLFSLIAIFSTLIPDLDNSSIGIFLKHRGIVHSLTFAVIIGLILIPLISLNNTLAFWLGYVVHLIADGMTISGVPLLWPIKKRFRLKLFKTGGITEHLLFYGLIALLVVSILKYIF